MSFLLRSQNFLFWLKCTNAVSLFLHDQETSQFFFFIIFESHICFSAVFSADMTENYISILWWHCCLSSRGFSSFWTADSCKFYSLADICPHNMRTLAALLLCWIEFTHSTVFAPTIQMTSFLTSSFNGSPFMLFIWLELSLIRLILYVESLEAVLSIASCRKIRVLDTAAAVCWLSGRMNGMRIISGL